MKLTTTIRPVAPFDFDLTAGYHTYFQSRYGTDSMEDVEYHRLLDLGTRLVLPPARSWASCATCTEVGATPSL